VQGENCWCSNYIPSNQQSTSKCNEPCPGYPSDSCGSSSGLFGYIALNIKPSGTAGASSSAAKSLVSSNTPSSPAPLSSSSSPPVSSVRSSSFVAALIPVSPPSQHTCASVIALRNTLMDCLSICSYTLVSKAEWQYYARLDYLCLDFWSALSASFSDCGLNVLPCRQLPRDGYLLLLLPLLLPLRKKQQLRLLFSKRLLRKRALCIY
jgi:hypothetical protein